MHAAAQSNAQLYDLIIMHQILDINWVLIR